MRKTCGTLALALLILLVSASSVRADDVKGVTRVTIGNAGFGGTGPYVVSADGTLSVDSRYTYQGVGFEAVNLNPGGMPPSYAGVTNPYDGPPQSGGAAVPVIGNAFNIPNKGKYKATFTMFYTDKDGKVQSASDGGKEVTIN